MEAVCTAKMAECKDESWCLRFDGCSTGAHTEGQRAACGQNRSRYGVSPSPMSPQQLSHRNHSSLRAAWKPGDLDRTGTEEKGGRLVSRHEAK